VCRWVTSFSGDSWLNLDRLDGITIMGSGGAGGWIVIAERRGLPNTVLGRFEDKSAALSRVRILIGDTE
jgi:hypothetical protein